MKYKFSFKELIRAPLSNLLEIKLLQLVLEQLKIEQNEAVISIGSGNGLDCCMISKYAREVIGIDISKPVIDTLAQRHWRPNVSFYAIDATKECPTEFVNRFDKCICTEVLEHVSDPSGLVMFIVNALRPGGRVVMSFPLENTTHGQNLLTQEKVSILFGNIPELRFETWIQDSNFAGRFLDRLYFKIQGMLKAPKQEADRFEETTAFEMMVKSRRIHSVYKLGIVLLAKVPMSSYCIRKGSGGRMILIAERI